METCHLIKGEVWYSFVNNCHSQKKYGRNYGYNKGVGDLKGYKPIVRKLLNNKISSNHQFFFYFHGLQLLQVVFSKSCAARISSPISVSLRFAD